MATSFGALCTDFYVNQKLLLKMDLPSDRETVLHLFDRIRKAQPSMNRFRRYEGELALESSRLGTDYRWLALRRASLRSGHVNPSSMDEAYQLHRLALDVAPYHLTISPLDVDSIELMFGFDLECKGNHDEVVYDALIANSPMAELFKVPDAKIVEVQPLFGLSLNQEGDLHACYEVKTRTKTRRGRASRRYQEEPISIFSYRAQIWSHKTDRRYARNLQHPGSTCRDAGQRAGHSQPPHTDFTTNYFQQRLVTLIGHH